MQMEVHYMNWNISITLEYNRVSNMLHQNSITLEFLIPWEFWCQNSVRNFSIGISNISDVVISKVQICQNFDTLEIQICKNSKTLIFLYITYSNKSEIDIYHTSDNVDKPEILILWKFCYQQYQYIWHSDMLEFW